MTPSGTEESAAGRGVAPAIRATPSAGAGDRMSAARPSAGAIARTMRGDERIVI